MSFNVGSPGIKKVYVRDGIRISNEIDFLVTAPIVRPDPIIDSIDPAITDTNSSIVLNVLGQHFQSSAEILVNNVVQMTIFVNDTKAQTGIFNVGVPGSKNVQVRQGTSLSNIVTLEVRALPTIVLTNVPNLISSQHYWHSLSVYATGAASVNTKLFVNDVEMPGTTSWSLLSQLWFVYTTPGRYFGVGMHAFQLKDLVSGAFSNIVMVQSV